MNTGWTAKWIGWWGIVPLAFFLGCVAENGQDARQPASHATGLSVEPAVPASREELAPSPEETAGLSEEVSRMLLERREALARLASNPSTSAGALAAAHGDLGMVYHAYKLYRLADICYTRATRGEPDEFRWWYFLGKIKQRRLYLDKSLECFLKAYRIDPDQVTLLVELGEIYRKMNELERAKAMFGRALELQRGCLPALVGLAQIANLEKQHGEALKLAQTALSYQPESSIIHYIAGLACRGLGDLVRAEWYLRPRENATGGILFQDPWMERIRALGSNAKQIFAAGNRALARGRVADALARFRLALREDPQNPAYRSKLAWVLLQKGDKAGALAEYRILARDRPGNANIHYNMGGLLLELARPGEAVSAFRRVLRLEPGYQGAALYLADALRLDSHYQEAFEQYRNVVTRQPMLAAARIGRALMAIRLERYQAARDFLEEDLKTLPAVVFFRLALARVLATSPLDTVRDGTRAFTLAQPAMGVQPRLEGLETGAMAAAELGRFARAVALQTRALSMVPQGDPHEVIAGQRLESYRARRALRRPWEWREPIYSSPSYARRR